MTTQKPGYASQSEAYQALLQAGAAPNVALILAAVTRPESSGYTYATNNYQGNQYLGLWQIGSFHGFDNARLRSDDIQYQAAAALKVYEEQGFGAWQTYTNKSYLQYLDQTNTALALAHANNFSIANSPALSAQAVQNLMADDSINLPAATKEAEGIPLDPFNWAALGQGPLAAQPTAIDSPGAGVNAASAPDTGPTAIDGPGGQLDSGAPNPIDSPGQNTAAGNPIDGPIGFDESVSPGGE